MPVPTAWSPSSARGAGRGGGGRRGGGAGDPAAVRRRVVASPAPRASHWLSRHGRVAGDLPPGGSRPSGLSLADGLCDRRLGLRLAWLAAAGRGRHDGCRAHGRPPRSTRSRRRRSGGAGPRPGPRRRGRGAGRAVRDHAPPPGAAAGRRSPRGHGVHLPAAGALVRPRCRPPGRPGTGGRRPQLPAVERGCRRPRPAGSGRVCAACGTGGPLCVGRPLRPLAGRLGGHRRAAPGRGLAGEGGGRRQRARRPGGGLPRRAGLVRQERQPVAPGRGQLVRPGHGHHRRTAGPCRPAGRRRVRHVHPLPGRLPHRGDRAARGWWTLAAAWRGCSRSRASSPGSTGWRSAIGCTAATTARRSAHPTGVSTARSPPPPPVRRRR